MEKYHPIEGLHDKTYYGVPRPAKGGEFVLVDFAVDPYEDQPESEETLECLNQWKKVDKVLKNGQ